MSLRSMGLHAVQLALFLLIVPAAYAGDSSTGHSSIPLSMARAEQLALIEDPVVARHQSLATALNEQAVADRQWPDPKLKFGVQGLPTDSFELDQEAMTQLQLGLVQAFPRGDSLRLKSEQDRHQATAEQARVAEQQRKIVRAVRNSYLEVLYQTHAGRIVDKSRALFGQLLNITQSHYSAGRSAQQDVLRAQLELTLLDDRRTRIRSAEEQARADLAKWIGEAEASRPLAQKLPALPQLGDRAELLEQLAQHPLLRIENATIDASNSAVELARQRYKPAWSLDITYGQRSGEQPDGSERPDLLSAMVKVDLPLFTKNRQDRRLEASRQKAVAARYARDDRLRELRRQLENQYAHWRRLDERFSHYREQVMPQAIQHSSAALNAYQSRVIEFTTLMRAYLTELESRLQTLRVEIDRAKTQAHLLYLAGETS